MVFRMHVCLSFPGRAPALPPYWWTQEWTCSPTGCWRSQISPTTTRAATPAPCRTATCLSVPSWKCSVSEKLCPLAADVFCTECGFSQHYLSPLLSPPDRTVILSPPQALKVQPGNTAAFTCLSLVDPKLGTPQIQWRKNDQKLYESHSDAK